MKKRLKKALEDYLLLEEERTKLQFRLEDAHSQVEIALKALNEIISYNQPTTQTSWWQDYFKLKDIAMDALIKIVGYKGEEE